MKIYRRSLLLRLFSAIALAGMMASSGHCYEIDTHAGMSGEAAKQSVINNVLPDLGLVSLDDIVQNLTLLDWIREGARREDDTFSEAFARYRNHFFDSRPDAPNNGGFTGFLPGILNLLSGLPAPDWALEPAPISSQIFGFKHGRSYFFDALTKSTKADRDASLALTFRTIGQVIHVVQDMGQPQHTRNDSHLLPSLFERYVDRANVRTQPGFFLGGSIPQFNRSRDFFTNDQGTGLAQYTNRAFVSQDTNFRWDGTMAQPNATYASPIPLPNPEVASVQNLDVPQAIKNYCGTDPGCDMRFYASQSDRGEVQPRATTLSIFADDLDLFNINSPDIDQGVRFSLNTLNFQAVLPNLVPRAVGHSAGMINYFFRGKIDFKKDEQDPTKFRIVNLGSESMNGRFALYYDAKDGNRYPVKVDPTDPNVDPNDANAWRLAISAQPTANRSAPVAFIAPANDGSPTSPKTVNEYMLVFGGDMGEENAGSGLGAVAGRLVNLNGAAYLITDNPGSGSLLYSSRDLGVTWTLISNLSLSLTPDWTPSRLLAANGKLYLLASNQTTGDRKIYTSGDTGVTWNAVFSMTADDAFSGDLVRNSHGVIAFSLSSDAVYSSVDVIPVAVGKHQPNVDFGTAFGLGASVDFFYIGWEVFAFPSFTLLDSSHSNDFPYPTGDSGTWYVVSDPLTPVVSGFDTTDSDIEYAVITESDITYQRQSDTLGLYRSPVPSPIITTSFYHIPFPASFIPSGYILRNVVRSKGTRTNNVLNTGQIFKETVSGHFYRIVDGSLETGAPVFPTYDTVRGLKPLGDKIAANATQTVLNGSGVWETSSLSLKSDSNVSGYSPATFDGKLNSDMDAFDKGETVSMSITNGDSVYRSLNDFGSSALVLTAGVSQFFSFIRNLGGANWIAVGEDFGANNPVSMVWRSDDDGVTWNSTSVGFSVDNGVLLTRVGASVDKSCLVVGFDQTEVDAWNARGNAPPNPLPNGVWLTTDGGATWNKQGTIPIGQQGRVSGIEWSGAEDEIYHQHELNPLSSE